MSKYKINDEIVNAYINGNDLTLYKNNDCYSFGLKGQEKQEPIFFEPDPAFKLDVARATNEIKNIIENIDLTRISRVNRFIGDISEFENSIEINLIVGYPGKIKFLTYVNEDSSKAFIVIDVLNTLLYYGQLEILRDEVEKYLKYILVDLIIGTKLPVDYDSKQSMLESLMFSASYADYISEINHWEAFTEAVPVATILEYTEYTILKQVEKRKDETKAEKYLYSVVSCDPEVYDFAIVGKRYLASLSEDDAYNMFSKTAKEFIINALENKENKKAIILPKLSKWITMACIALLALFIIFFIPCVFFNFYTFIYSLIPFPFAILVIVRGLVNYKMGVISNKKFIISTLIAFIFTICYLIFIF